MVRGLENAKKIASNTSVLAVSNHSAWWDPLLALMVSQHWLGCEGHALMDARNLRRLPFFSLVGAFGVDLQRPADGALAIKYAARLLQTPRTLVWVFPQGRERPLGERPLGFRPGAAEIARVAKRALTLPIGIHYAFCGEEKPWLYISFGPPLEPERNVKRGLELQEQAVTHELERIHVAMAAHAEGDIPGEFMCMHRRLPSRAARFAETLLAWITRPFTGIPSAPPTAPHLPPR